MMTLPKQFAQMARCVVVEYQQFQTIEGDLSSVRLFRNLFIGFQIFQTLSLLPWHSQLWGTDVSFSRPTFSGSPMDYLTKVLSHESLCDLYPFFIITQLVSLSLIIMGFSSRILLILSWFLTINLYGYCYPVSDGGTNLSDLLFFFFLFVNSSGFTTKASYLRSLTVPLHNAFLFIMRMQIALLYLCAAIFKLNGQLWASGMSLFYILQSGTFSHPLLHDLVIAYPHVTTIGTYATVCFQYLFPILIWNQKTKYFVIFFGCILHGLIGLTMGLFHFGTIMIVSYSLFFDEKVSRSILNTFSIKGRLLVGYDFNCAICMKFARFIEKIDWLSAVEIDNANDPRNPELRSISLEERTTSIVAFDCKANEYVFGFNSVARIFAKTILGWPFVPCLLLIKYVGLGDLIYRDLTKLRRVNCNSNCQMAK